MSLDFWTKPRLHMDQLFDGQLGNRGIYEHVVAGKTTNNIKCLVDEHDWVWVYGSKGLVSCITVYCGSYAYGIFKAISEVYDVAIWLEQDIQTCSHKLMIERPNWSVYHPRKVVL